MWLQARYPAALACILHKCKVLGKLPEVMKLHDSIYALIYEVWSSDYAVVCMHFCNIDNTRTSELDSTRALSNHSVMALADPLFLLEDVLLIV